MFAHLSLAISWAFKFLAFQVYELVNSILISVPENYLKIVALNNINVMFLNNEEFKLMSENPLNEQMKR